MIEIQRKGREIIFNQSHPGLLKVARIQYQSKYLFAVCVISIVFTDMLAVGLILQGSGVAVERQVD